MGISHPFPAQAGLASLLCGSCSPRLSRSGYSPPEEEPAAQSSSSSSRAVADAPCDSDASSEEDRPSREAFGGGGTDGARSSSSGGGGGAAARPTPPAAGGEASKSLPDWKTGHWSAAEHNLFLDGLARFGKRWDRVAELVGSRTMAQVRSHAQKYFKKPDAYEPAAPADPRPRKRESRTGVYESPSAKRPTAAAAASGREPRRPRSSAKQHNNGAAGSAAASSGLEALAFLAAQQMTAPPPENVFVVDGFEIVEHDGPPAPRGRKRSRDARRTHAWCGPDCVCAPRPTPEADADDATVVVTPLASTTSLPSFDVAKPAPYEPSTVSDDTRDDGDDAPRRPRDDGTVPAKRARVPSRKILDTAEVFA